MDNKLLPIKYYQFSKYANFNEIRYREEIQSVEEVCAKVFSDRRIEILPFLIKIGLRFYGKVIELGAGSCWFTALLSRLPEVEEVYACDISERLLTE